MLPCSAKFVTSSPPLFPLFPYSPISIHFLISQYIFSPKPLYVKILLILVHQYNEIYHTECNSPKQHKLIPYEKNYLNYRHTVERGYNVCTNSYSKNWKCC